MFAYDQAFKRNIGWVSAEEQNRIKDFTIAIGGLGGVGGSHAITMARMGFTKFRIADLDHYELSNFNRQDGANIQNIGRSKIGVTVETLMVINPNIEITRFDNGLSKDNIDEFLTGADIYLDSLDIFALDIRRHVFESCAALNIPALTAAPLGMGTAFLAFLPHTGMDFKTYFDMRDPSPAAISKALNKPATLYMLHLEHYIDNIIRFISGVAASAMQRHYLIDKTKVNFFTKDVPSLKVGIDMAAGVLCSNAVKILLHRGDVPAAPHGLHFDAYLNTCKKTWRPMGQKNPLSALTRHIIRRLLNVDDMLSHIRHELEQAEKDGKLKPYYSSDDLYILLQKYRQQATS